MLLRKTLCAYEIPVLWNFTAEAAYKKQSCQVPLDTGIFAWNFKNLKPKQPLISENQKSPAYKKKCATTHTN